MKNKKRYLIYSFILLTLLILSGYIYRISQITNQLIYENIESQVMQSEQYISNNIKSTMSVLESVSDTITRDIPDFDLEKINRYIECYVMSGSFLYMNFADANGTLYHFDGTTEDISGLEGFQNALARKNTLSHSVYNKDANENLIYYTVPVYKGSKVAGALIGARYTKDVSEKLMDDFGTDDFISVVLSVDGTVILCSNAIVSIETGEPFFKRLQADNKFTSRKEYEKIRKDFAMEHSGIIHLNKTTKGYIAYQKINESKDWYYLCYVKPESFSDYSKAMLLISFGTLFAVLIIVLGMTLFIFFQEKRKMIELEETRHMDRLTHIPNEIGFQKRVTDILKKDEASVYAMVYLDVDNFKFINHNFSYRLGDELLIKIGGRLYEMAKDYGTAARISSDSFAMLIKYEKNQMDIIRKSLYDEIYEGFGESIAKMIHCPMGYYLIKNRYEKIRVMMDKASYAWKYAKQHKMTQAKEYDDEIMEYQVKLKRIENSQHYALSHKEFQVFFQPKVDLKSNRVVGAEALVRWISKEYGFMPPDDFIPIFENNGFVKEIDFYVLERVCEYLRMILDMEEEPATISINQSRITIMDEFYLERLEAVMERYEIPRKYIDLEVTESLFVGDYNAIIEILKKVKELGFLISMDDFGSGYSSLNLLKEMPIDNLKIDKVFLDESTTSSQSRIIIKSVIDMAKNLNMAVVCEGVETPEQVDFLKKMNCDVAQGYYYDRPVRIEQFQKKLKDGSYDFS